MIKSWVAAMVVLLGLALGAPGWAAPIYTMTLLGPFVDDRLGSLPTVALDLNASGQIVGYASFSGNSSAILWQDGAVVRLDDWSGGLAGSGSQAHAINDHGQIAGYATVRGRRQAALWAQGRFTNLDPSSASSAAYDIDAQGRAVGVSGSEPALFAGGSVSRLATATGQAFGISPTTGLVVGSRLDLFDRASSFQLGSARDLPDPSLSSAALAVNDGGQIVGMGRVCRNGTPQPLGSCALSWTGGQATLLDTLGGGTAAANDINASGQIVGSAATADNLLHAAIWQAGQVADLNDLIVNLGDWQVVEAMAINDLGQIVGQAFNASSRETRSFLLTPGVISAPSSPWLVMGAGLALLVAGAGGAGSRSRPRLRPWRR